MTVYNPRSGGEDTLGCLLVVLAWIAGAVAFGLWLDGKAVAW